MQDQRNTSYSAAHFALELGEGKLGGFFRSVEGGNVKAEIMTYQVGASTHHWRQLGRPKYEDLKIQVGMAMSPIFYDWLESFFSGRVVRKDGAIVAGDFTYKERARRTFYAALISAIDFPKLDANDKNPCYMTVTISPEWMRFEPSKNAVLEPEKTGVKQKLWTASNFDFVIDGLKENCGRVTKIDGFSIKQKIHEYRAGNLRDPIRVPGILEFPNLTFYLPEADAKPFIDHFDKYVIKGARQQGSRLTGVINLLDHAKGVLCEITLEGVDLASVTPEKSDASTDQIKEVKVEISVESMKFDYKQNNAPASMLE